jgi:hypothetical protein
MVAKWQSVVNHMHNVHTNHSQLFTACQHEVFDDNQVKRTKWVKPNTKASTKVEAIVLAKLLQKDILKLSPAEQTCAVESYHCVINYFAPKLHVFSYHGCMVACYWLLYTTMRMHIDLKLQHVMVLCDMSLSFLSSRKVATVYVR